MLSQSRGLRFALVLLMSLGYVAMHGHYQVAQAKGGGNDGGDDDGDDGDDGGGGGGGDAEEPDDEEVDEDQPPVTAGGLFTLKTYPVRELSRPLTMTEGLFQARIGVGTDVSAKTAFESFGVSAEGRYGFKDNVTGLGGLTSAYNFKQFGFYAGFEASLAYDLIDFRAAFRISRAAAAGTMDNGMGMQVPSGKLVAGKIQESIDIGFPFRYVAKPEIAIVALDTLMSIDFNSKPDLNPSIGISTCPIPALSVVVFAQLQIPDFNTDKGNLKVPATARVQFSPNQKLDLGAEFTFLNVKPPDGVKFYDQRFLSFYLQFRAGK